MNLGQRSYEEYKQSRKKTGQSTLTSLVAMDIETAPFFTTPSVSSVQSISPEVQTSNNQASRSVARRRLHNDCNQAFFSAGLPSYQALPALSVPALHEIQTSDLVNLSLPHNSSVAAANLGSAPSHTLPAAKKAARAVTFNLDPKASKASETSDKSNQRMTDPVANLNGKSSAAEDASSAISIEMPKPDSIKRPNLKETATDSFASQKLKALFVKPTVSFPQSAQSKSVVEADISTSQVPQDEKLENFPEENFDLPETELIPLIAHAPTKAESVSEAVKLLFFKEPPKKSQPENSNAASKISATITTSLKTEEELTNKLCDDLEAVYNLHREGSFQEAYNYLYSLLTDCSVAAHKNTVIFFIKAMEINSNRIITKEEKMLYVPGDYQPKFTQLKALKSTHKFNPKVEDFLAYERLRYKLSITPKKDEVYVRDNNVDLAVEEQRRLLARNQQEAVPHWFRNSL